MTKQNRNINNRIIFLIAILWVTLLNAHDNLNDAEKAYQRALDYMKIEKQDLAIKELKQALRLNRKMAKAHHQLALIYMNEGTVHGRFMATFEIEKAIHLEPANLQYRFDQAVLNVKKGMTFLAESQFKKILKRNPDCYEAYLYLASLKENEMLHYQDMVSIEPGSDGIIFLQKFAMELMEEAASYYKKAISIKPGETKAYFKLALIYYEFENYNEMAQLLETAVKINPDDKNSHLFLGFAYQNTKKYKLALQEYEKARSLMTPSEIYQLENIVPILSPNEQKLYQQLSDEEKEKFRITYWIEKDPFYLTDENERLLEHYSRIAYANLRFSRPDKKIQGWETDQGKVYIRFGNPKNRFRTRPYIGASMNGTRNPLVHSREFWIYPDFTIKFEDEYLSGNYTLARDVRPEFDYKYIFEELIKKQPDNFQMLPDSMLFDVPVEIISFMGDNFCTELEFCYCIPTEAISPQDFERKEYRIKEGLFLFDYDWNLIDSSKSEIWFDSRHEVEINGEKYLAFHEKSIVQPGTYHYALEFEDAISGKRAAVHQEAQAETFLTNRLQLSDILFACKIAPGYVRRNISRSDFYILPNPMRFYQRDESVAIYFEIYNLSQNQAGETQYKIEYRIGPDYQSQPVWRKFLKNVGFFRKEGEVTTSYIYSGKKLNEFHYQSFGLGEDLKGRIKLQVIVTDLISNEVVQKKEFFQVIH